MPYIVCIEVIDSIVKIAKVRGVMFNITGGRGYNLPTGAIEQKDPSFQQVLSRKGIFGTIG